MTHSGVAHRPPRVAQVVDTLSVGGAERVAVNLANGLAERGYESHLLVSRSMGPLAAALRPDVQVACAERTWRFDAAGIRRMVHYIDSHEIDVVHSHNHHPSYLLRVVFWFSKRKPLHVIHDHHGPALGDWKMGLYDWLMLRHVDAYIAVTKELRARAARLLALPEDRCLFLPNGVEIPPPSPPWRGRPTVIQVANLRPPKGHATAMCAAARLRESLPDLRWVCVGKIPEGPSDYLKEVQGLMDSLKLSGCVEILGARKDVPALLRQAHVGVLTSDVEGLPMAILEYLAEQLPVVMTDVGQGPAILRDARAGLVVPPADPDRFAEALREIWRDPDEARRMGERGRAYVAAHCGMDAMVERVRSVYESLLATT